MPRKLRGFWVPGFPVKIYIMKKISIIIALLLVSSFSFASNQKPVKHSPLVKAVMSVFSSDCGCSDCKPKQIPPRPSKPN